MPAVRLAGAWVCSMGDGGFGGGESRVRYAVVCFKLEFIAIIDHVPWLIESLDCGGGVVLFAFAVFWVPPHTSSASEPEQARISTAECSVYLTGPFPKES